VIVTPLPAMAGPDASNAAPRPSELKLRAAKVGSERMEKRQSL
jgi:hypothetical protein